MRLVGNNLNYDSIVHQLCTPYSALLYLARGLKIINFRVLKTQILSLSVSKHLLVSYWGQNSSGAKFPQNPEKDLTDVCAERKYDIIVIGFVVTFFGKNNKGKYQ